MATIYSCKECRTNLNLATNHLFPSDFYFEAGNKNSISFAWIDQSKFKFEKEDKIRPFFETLNYWGIQRNRTKIKCNNCGKLVGYVYDDGPPMVDTPGQFHFGPSQVIPRNPRYDVEEGGETVFPSAKGIITVVKKARLSVKPKMGDAFLIVLEHEA